LTLAHNRFISILKTQPRKEYSNEPTEQNHAQEVSGDCTMPVGFERLRPAQAKDCFGSSVWMLELWRMWQWPTVRLSL